MESDAVVVDVQMTPDDGAALHSSTSRAAQVRPHYQLLLVFAMIWIVLALAFGPDLLIDFVNRNRPFGVMISVFMGALPFLLILYFVIRDQSKRMHDPRGLFLRPHQISVSSRGISFKSDVADLKYDWQAFLRVEETPTHFFLYPDRLMAYVVPKRHFASPEETNRFGAILLANIKPAQLAA